MTSPTVVVKVGGGRLDDGAWLGELAAAARALTPHARLLFVHGGGRDVTRLLERLGLGSSWIGGRRVTGEAQLEAVRMALSGAANKRLVRSLRDAGVPAVGLSGEDGALEARPARDAALGRVGEPHSVGVELLETLLRAGLVPVLSPLSRGPDGEGLNVNADAAAAAVAAALVADRLIFVTDVPGVLVEGRALERVTPGAFAELRAAGAVHSGMLPKLEAAAGAARRVGDVRIGELACLLDGQRGSRVLAGAEAA